MTDKKAAGAQTSGLTGQARASDDLELGDRVTRLELALKAMPETDSQAGEQFKKLADLIAPVMPYLEKLAAGETISVEIEGKADLDKSIADLKSRLDALDELRDEHLANADLVKVEPLDDDGLRKRVVELAHQLEYVANQSNIRLPSIGG